MAQSAKEFEVRLRQDKLNKEVVFIFMHLCFLVVFIAMCFFANRSGTSIVLSLTGSALRAYGLIRRGWGLSDWSISTYSAIVLFIEMLCHMSMDPKNWCLFPSQISEIWFADVVLCPRCFKQDLLNVFDENFLVMSLNLCYMVAFSITFEQSCMVVGSVAIIHHGIFAIEWLGSSSSQVVAACLDGASDWTTKEIGLAASFLFGSVLFPILLALSVRTQTNLSKDMLASLRLQDDAIAEQKRKLFSAGFQWELLKARYSNNGQQDERTSYSGTSIAIPTDSVVWVQQREHPVLCNDNVGEELRYNEAADAYLETDVVARVNVLGDGTSLVVSTSHACHQAAASRGCVQVGDLQPGHHTMMFLKIVPVTAEETTQYSVLVLGQAPAKDTGSNDAVPGSVRAHKRFLDTFPGVEERQSLLHRCKSDPSLQHDISTPSHEVSGETGAKRTAHRFAGCSAEANSSVAQKLGRSVQL